MKRSSNTHKDDPLLIGIVGIVLVICIAATWFMPVLGMLILQGIIHFQLHF